MKKNIILDKSFDFAVSIVKLYQQLQENKEFVISKQLLRSGTSIGANVHEATAAFSKKDFAYRMSIAAKEARETRFWLLLLDRTHLVYMDYVPYLDSLEEIDKILTAIVKKVNPRLFEK